MDSHQIVLLAGIGLASGFMAGFVGIGGGVVIIPLLVYGAGLSVKLAMGISMMQVLFSTASGVLAHRRHGTVDARLGVTLGTAGMVGATIGSFGSALLDSGVLLMLYFSLVASAILLLGFGPEQGSPDKMNRSHARSLPLGFGVGVLSGMLGIGGGFIMTPLMMTVLRVPTRIAVATSLLVLLMSSLAGSIGKVATGQFDLLMAAPVVVCGILGAQLGAVANSRVSVTAIRVCLILLLVAILLRTGVDLAGWLFKGVIQ